MERLRASRSTTWPGMTGAGIDTEAVLRTGMIGFMEGPCSTASSTATCTAATSSCWPTGAPPCSTSASPVGSASPGASPSSASSSPRSMNDVRGQLEAVRDLGALPADVDLDEVIDDLGLDQPAGRPHHPDRRGDRPAELQRVLKGLLGYGAQLPKELMLFVKNLVFLDGAIATLAPDLDLFAEIAAHLHVLRHHHGERIATEVGSTRTTARSTSPR